MDKQMSILSLILFPTGFVNMMEMLDRSNKHHRATGLTLFTKSA